MAASLGSGSGATGSATAPEGKLSLMRRLLGHCLVPAVAGVAAARHLAWYVSYQMSGDARN